MSVRAQAWLMCSFNAHEPTPVTRPYDKNGIEEMGMRRDLDHVRLSRSTGDTALSKYVGLAR